MNIRALIVDDEQNARKMLRRMLARHSSSVTVVGEADNVETGYHLIIQRDPDIIFLDIRLGDASGFDLLRRFEKPRHHVIFVSAYEEFAIRAFKFNAIDYLLKPVDAGELRQAIERYSKKTDNDDHDRRQREMMKQMEDSSLPERIAIRTQESIHFLLIEDIIRCQSDEGYTHFILKDNGNLTVASPLREFEELLAPHNFHRVHQSHLLNARHIVRFDRKTGTFLLTNDENIPLSSRRHHVLNRIFR